MAKPGIPHGVVARTSRGQGQTKVTSEPNQPLPDGHFEALLLAKTTHR